ncbi:DUF536 domain-containing protein [Streptococcus merionis]|uniref:DNA-binding protein n=1 Tax=Streptococcus merionis TaxID=400065 RepID=A0A239T0G9_9STRE|nr:DUF536 domain-containing protein [Streptococcus merionis]SNU91220.1 DNA-binding protein [Streptococcus merionis]
MSVEKTVSEIADILGISRQAVNNRVKAFPEEFVDKNEKGVTVVNRAGLIELEKHYKKTIFEDEPVSEETKQRELMEILVDEKNAEIVRLYEQLKIKDEQIAAKDEQIRIKDVQISEKDKQLDQQQQLTAKAMNDRDSLKLELDAVQAQAEEAQAEAKELESRSFFAKLFGRK